MSKLKCTKCNEDCEFIYMKTKYNGNTDTSEYCGKCYYLTFGELFANTTYEVMDEKNVATKVVGLQQ